MSVARDATRTLALQLIGLASGIVTNVVVARTLGPEGKGLLSYLGYSLFVSVSLGGLGLAASAVQHIGKKRFPVETVAGTQILLSLASGTAAAGVLAFVLLRFQGRIDLPLELILPLLLVVVVSLLQTNLIGVLIGAGRIRDANWIQLLTPLGWMTGAVAVLWIAGGGAREAAWTWMAMQLLGGLAALAWVIVRLRASRREFRASARSALRFGLEAYLANLLWVLLLRVDGLLLGALGGAAAVGIYSISVLMAELLWYAPRAVTLALNPRIVSGSAADAMSLALRGSRTALWIVLVGAAGLVVFARPVIRLVLGDAFLPAYIPLLLLLPGVISGTISSPLSLYMTQQRGRPRVNAWVSGIGLALNLALNAWLIPAYGARGAAVASSVAYIVVSGLLLWAVRREPGFSAARLVRPRKEDLALLREAWAALSRRGER